MAKADRCVQNCCPLDAFQLTAYLPIRRELDPLPLDRTVWRLFPVGSAAHTAARPARWTSGCGLRGDAAGRRASSRRRNRPKTALEACRLKHAWSCCCRWSALMTKGLFGSGYGGGFLRPHPGLCSGTQGRERRPPSGSAYDSQRVAERRCPWSRRTKGSACRHYTPTSGLRRATPRT